ncbi:MAG: tRNA (5-methylaminomethyl-2-thiouridine)(34)-methyltransferase MnmD [Bacteroidales bacterium]|nr:tRNA (5-methylaminomethyl-2-thiouridine)(34)-methyltransferase MnmD [Bacteroidales bacterium]
MKRQIKITKDGSATLYVPELNEHYHSVNGAIQESKHVFIQAGLYHLKKNTLSIFEVGLGTGLNVLLTYLELKNKPLEIDYFSIELFPISDEEQHLLNYAETLNLSKEDAQIFSFIHSSDWNTKIQLSKGFILTKISADLLSYPIPFTFDLVYFDAFAPEVQPELWTNAVFQKIYTGMNPAGILTTYCAKGVVRRTLQETGFIVERLPGSPGKREMLRAVKPA